MKLGNRHGDAAPVSIIELVDRGEAEAKDTPAPSEKPAKKKAKVEAAAADAPKKKASKKKAEDQTAEEKPSKKKAKKSEE